MELRYYQEEARQALYEYLEHRTGNPCVVLPTGSGKTPLLAAICRDVTAWGGRVLILAHVKELLEQAADKLAHFLAVDMVGIYSAGLKSRDTTHQVIIAGIQSVYKRSSELGGFDLIIVDEAHLIPAHEGGMYRTFFDHQQLTNPKVRIIGLTATPYRLDSGWICAPDNILTDIAYEVGIKELIFRGFLCPIRTKSGTEHPDLSNVHVRGGEFIDGEMASAMDAIVVPAINEAVELVADRKSVLIFSAGVDHGAHIAEVLRERTGEAVGFLTGETPAHERADLIRDFREGRLRWLVNVNVLTIGFDAPNVDAIILLRATLSPGLYYQMVGRGLRIAEGKEDCVILDYGENVLRHGPVDAIRINEKSGKKGEGEAPVKECPNCHELVHAARAICPECLHVFPEREPDHDTRAGDGSILSGEVVVMEKLIERVEYYVHKKRGRPDAPTTMRVEYHTHGLNGDIYKEWVCFNHEGFAREKAAAWWRLRSDLPLPGGTEDAVFLAQHGAVVEPTRITVREVSGDPFPRITDYELPDVKPGRDVVEQSMAEDEKLKMEMINEGWGDVAEPVAAGDWFEGEDIDIPF